MPRITPQPSLITYVRMAQGVGSLRSPMDVVQSFAEPYVPTSPQGEEIKAFYANPVHCARNR